MAPRLSIIVPVYNGAATVGRTIDSLGQIAQHDRRQVEVIVVDDGSTDESARIVHQAQYRIGGFDWINLAQPNRGLSAARNAALERVRGDWIWFLDADDELLIDLLQELPASGQVTSVGFSLEYERYGKRFRTVRPRLVDQRTRLDLLSASNPFQPSAVVFQRSSLSHAFDTTVDVVNDWLFWMQNKHIFDRMVRRDRSIARIHIHGSNMSSRVAVAGRNRAEIARRMLSCSSVTLSRHQRNNFFIQQQIGLMQQHKRFSPRAFVSWPCDAMLYAKALVYAVAATLNLRVTPY